MIVFRIGHLIRTMCQRCLCEQRNFAVILCHSRYRSAGQVGTRPNTPFGTPARSANWHNANAENGVAVAGFNTIVQPATRAGPHFWVIIAAGKLHGVIAAQTPIGSLVTTMRFSEAFYAGIVSGYRFGAGRLSTAKSAQSSDWFHFSFLFCSHWQCREHIVLTPPYF
jgi:hypothetical protein